MSITINKSDEHNDYFTLNDGTTDYLWHCKKDSNPDLDEVLLLIRNKEYPDALVVTQEAGSVDILEDITWPTVVELPEWSAELEGNKYFVEGDQHYIATDTEFIVYSLLTTPCEEISRTCQDLTEMDAWLTANPTVDPIAWTSTHPTGEVLDRGNISTETQTALETLRTNTPDLAPIIDVLIGSA